MKHQTYVNFINSCHKIDAVPVLIESVGEALFLKSFFPQSDYGLLWVGSYITNDLYVQHSGDNYNTTQMKNCPLLLGNADDFYDCNNVFYGICEKKLYPHRNKNFKVDWFSINVPIWEKYIKSEFLDKENLKLLEIGSFEGLSAVWLMENVLTDKSKGVLYCIDTFQGSMEHQQNPYLDIQNLYQRFLHNTMEYGTQIITLIGESKDILKSSTILTNLFDFIYIDGAHDGINILRDAILSFDILKIGGLLVFDDYIFQFSKAGSNDTARSINNFIQIYANCINVIHIEHQLILRKTLSC